MRLISNERGRLDKWLAAQLPEFSRSKLVRLIESGGVVVNGKVAKSSLALEPGAVVDLEAPDDSPVHDLTPADIPLHVLYEDDSLLVVNKPRGLATHPAASLSSPSLVNALLNRKGPLSQTAGDFRPGIVHRLDKDTSGLLVVAKTDSAHVILAKQIEKKTAERRYVAVVAGEVLRDKFRIDAPIARDHQDRKKMGVSSDGRPAGTQIKKLKRVEDGTLVGIRLETGRTHQIRVHLQAIGHPVLGDPIYAPKEWSVGALQLHAAFLGFLHPVTEEWMNFFVAPDSEFRAFEYVRQEDLEPF